MFELHPEISIEKAARFIYLSLESQARLSKNQEYQEFLQEYKNSTAFQKVVNSISQGLSLDIIDIVSGLLVLSPKPDSLFAEKTLKMKKLTEGDYKFFTPLILMGLAAYYFPRKESLDINANYTEPFNLIQFDEFMRNKCRYFEENASQISSIVGEENTTLAFKEYLALPTPDCKDSKSRSTSHSIIGKVIDYLTDEKMFLKRDDQYWLSPRFKPHMEKLASNPKLKEMILKFKGDNNAHNE